MRIFNKNRGSGSYVHNVGVHRYVIKPQEWTEVPDELGKALIAKYPKHLTSDEPGKEILDKRVGNAVKEAVKDKDAQIAELQAQLRKAQALALATPIATEPAVEAEKPKRGRPSNAAKASETASE